jgi:hypothetical protein
MWELLCNGEFIGMTNLILITANQTDLVKQRDLPHIWWFYNNKHWLRDQLCPATKPIFKDVSFNNINCNTGAFWHGWETQVCVKQPFRQCIWGIYSHHLYHHHPCPLPSSNAGQLLSHTFLDLGYSGNDPAALAVWRQVSGRRNNSKSWRLKE